MTSSPAGHRPGDANGVAHLRLLGLGDAEIRIYQRLLGTGPASVAELASAEDRPPDEIAAALDALAQTGLVGGAGRSQWVPVPPETGLDLLTARRESELRQVRVDVLNAYEKFRRTVHTQSTDDLVEVVTGPAIVERIWQVERSAQREILRLDSPPYYTSNKANPIEIEHLANGVAYRVVYSRAAVEEPGIFEENILPCIAAGEQARVLPDVPVKLSIIDGSLALVSRSVREADVNRSLLVVSPSSLLSALIGSFDLCWRTAVPITTESGPATSELEPMERRVLALLASGSSDETIARTLGVSRRTFFRYLERLMNRTGAATRFQLALYAARHDWL